MLEKLVESECIWLGITGVVMSGKPWQRQWCLANDLNVSESNSIQPNSIQIRLFYAKSVQI
jgi:hypothetical protein